MIKNFRWNEKISISFVHLIVAFMMACFGVTVMSFGQRLFPYWQGGYLPWLAFIISAESLYSYRVSRRFSIFSKEWVLYRASELIMIPLGLKVFIYFQRGFEPFLDDIRLWQQNPVQFFGGEYGAILSILFLIWWTSNLYAMDLSDLEGDEAFINLGRHKGIYPDRKMVRQQLANRFLLIGAVMIFMTTLIRLDLAFLWGELPPLETGAINVLAYFFLGLLMLSQVQFAILRGSWSISHIPVSGDIAGRWVRSSFFFFIALALVVSLLPTGYSLGLLESLGYVLGFLISLLNVLFFLCLFPFLWLGSFIGGGERFNSTSPIPFTGQEYFPQRLFAGDWWEVIRSLLFWFVFLGLTVFAIVQYARQNSDIVDYLHGLPGWKWLQKLWRRIWKTIKRINEEVNRVVDSSVKKFRGRKVVKEVRSIWRYVRINQLPPREQVLFFYRALLRRGREQGFPRHPAQTPAEYAQVLSQHFPDYKIEISVLSEVFVEAHYSLHEINDEKAHLVKQGWQRLRSAFRY